MTSGSATTAPASLGAYLRAVADALAAPTPTPDTILRAAGAQAVERDADHAYFRVPEPRLSRGMLKLTVVAGLAGPPGLARFEYDPAGRPVRLAELAATFGSWSRGMRRTSVVPVWRVRFDSVYRSAGPPHAGAAPVRVSADLSDDADAPGARVVQVYLQRDPTIEP